MTYGPERCSGGVARFSIAALAKIQAANRAPPGKRQRRVTSLKPLIAGSKAAQAAESPARSTIMDAGVP